MIIFILFIIPKIEAAILRVLLTVIDDCKIAGVQTAAFLAVNFSQSDHRRRVLRKGKSGPVYGIVKSGNKFLLDFKGIISVNRIRRNN